MITTLIYLPITNSFHFVAISCCLCFAFKYCFVDLGKNAELGRERFYCEMWVMRMRTRMKIRSRDECLKWMMKSGIRDR